MFRRLLVAFDGSPHAQQALSEAIDMARAARGTLTVMTVVPSPGVWAPRAAWEATIDVAALSREIERSYREMLDEAVYLVPGEIPVTKIVRHGSPAATIVDLANSGEHDLVIMGSRGRGSVRSLFLGSVSHQVINGSTVPVLVAHAAEEVRGSPEPRSQVVTA